MPKVPGLTLSLFWVHFERVGGHLRSLLEHRSRESILGAFEEDPRIEAPRPGGVQYRFVAVLTTSIPASASSNPALK